VGELNIFFRKRLREAGITSYALEARELIGRAMGVATDEVLKNAALFLSEKTTDAALALLDRRLAGEPCAYLLGEWDFYGRTFKVTPDVLIPRPDTETVVDKVLHIYPERNRKLRILDLCAGSGCIGITLALEFPEARAILMDISTGALQVAKENIARHGVESRAYTVQGDALDGWHEMLGKFDLIVSNPPYIPARDFATLDRSVSAYEPRLALDGGDDGLQFYRAIAEKWKQGLVSGGRLVVECGIGQAPHVVELFKRALLCRVGVTKDLAGIDRVVAAIGSLKRGG